MRQIPLSSSLIANNAMGHRNAEPAKDYQKLEGKVLTIALVHESIITLAQAGLLTCNSFIVLPIL